MNDPSGSRWRKWDLHFHTPKSFDYGNKALTPKAVADRLIQAGVEVVAVTDHHAMDASFIGEMRAAAGEHLTVLPGIEFACPLGGKEGVHFIGIFPEDANLPFLASELLSRSGLSTKRAGGKSETELYVDFIETAKIIHSLHGLVSIHGHGKASSIEGIANNSALKQQFKEDILREHVDLLEIGREERARDYLDIVFPALGFSRPLIIGSDDHANDRYPIHKYCWIKADPTFAGLRMALREPDYRFCLDEVPETVDRVDKHKTKYIKAISFETLESMPDGERWLQGRIPLNSGLVAVIGNKGSGKSALADSIGLLGSCANSDAFSFLEPERFRHPKTGRAQHIEGEMEWHAGDPQRRRLDAKVAPDEPERVKYLPQNFVEKVCNDLASPGGGDFEKELKKVVFSKVSPADQLGKRSLDDLVEFRTEELRIEAFDLAKQLNELGEDRARLELRLDPAVKTGLEKRIERKLEEIRSHEAMKPADRSAPPPDPSDDPNAQEDIAELESLRAARDAANAAIEAEEEQLGQQQIRVATSQKLLDKLSNLERAVERAVEDLHSETNALGLEPEALVKLSIDRGPVNEIRDVAQVRRDNALANISGTDTSPGLLTERDRADARIREIQEKLSRPQQEYQAYLEARQAWDLRLKALFGGIADSESLLGLQAELGDLEAVPERVQQVQDNQEKIAQSIHALRVKEADVFTELYAPVQKFIQEHPLASEHLKLEFKVELVEEGFANNLLDFLQQNRIGSFYGIEEGSKMAKALAAVVDWSKWEEVTGFLRMTVDYLHHDRRPDSAGISVLLSDQIAKGRTAGDLYRWLYGLSYLRPRYLLRWDGKDVAQLSPGERGTLLLIFYLLVDDSDLPLIIDQPEANLDNVTVAQKLVHCIRDARDRRQVIIVTHNPNLAVVCDADQIVHTTLDKPSGNRITYHTGALEHPEMNKFTIDVLEGGRSPFDMRDATYRVVGV